MLDADILQAFSHFTYTVHTMRVQIVCDVQGSLEVFNHSATFLLTDRAIHRSDGFKRFKSSCTSIIARTQRTRSIISGRIDRGLDGMTDFFKTRQCNSACRLLGLCRRRSQPGRH